MPRSGLWSLAYGEVRVATDAIGTQKTFIIMPHSGVADGPTPLRGFIGCGGAYSYGIAGYARLADRLCSNKRYALALATLRSLRRGCRMTDRSLCQ